MATRNSSSSGVVYLDTASAQAALDKLNAKIKAYDNELNKANTSAARRMTIEADRAKASEKAADIQKQIEKNLGATYNQQSRYVKALTSELKDLAVGTQEYNKKLLELRKAEGVFDEMKAKIKGVDDASSKLTTGGSGLTKVGVFFASFAANVATKAISAIQDFGAEVFQMNSRLEESTKNLSAITGATGSDLDFLKQSAIDLSKTGATSAVEFVEAFKLIASAKPELLDAKEDLVGVAKAAKLLADASGIDLPTAATKLTDALNQFGAPASEAAKYVDALAAASKFGAAEVPEVTDALLKFGSLAKASNIDIYESAAAIELLAEKGLKGADAGTALRNVFIKLSAVDALPKEAISQLAQAGVNTEILKDKNLSLEERLKELSKVQNNTTALVKIFGSENLNAGQIVLQNIPRYAELSSQIKEQGVAAKQAATNTDTLGVKWAQFKNVLASRVLSGSNDFLKGLVETMIKVVEPTKTATEEFKQLSSTVGHLEKDIVPLADRYDELKKKTTLSKDEQAEMKSIISQISSIMPGAVSAQDSYGNAIAINTGRVREFVQAEKDRLQVVNKSAIEEQTRNMERLANQIRVVGSQLDEVNKTGTFKISEDLGMGVASIRKASQEEVRALQERNVKLLSEYRGTFQQIKSLNGTAIQEQADAQAEAAKKAEEERKKAQAQGNQGNGQTFTEDQLKAEKKAADERKRLLEQYNEFVKGLNQSITDTLTPEASKKFAAILRETADGLEKLKKLAQGDEQYQKGKALILENQRVAIHALVEEESKLYKPAPEQVSTVDPSSVSGALRNSLPKQPVKVPIEILPEIKPEDEKAVSAALAAVLNRLQRNSKAGFQLDVLKAGSSGERRDALLAQLADEHSLEMKNKDLTDNEMLVKEEEYQQKRKAIISQHQQEIVGILQQGLEFAGQAVDILGKFAEAASTRENAALQKEIKNSDVRKKMIQDQANRKIISNQEAARQIAAIDQDISNKKEAQAKKEFERNKKFQLAQAAINGALAITNIWATTPKFDFGVSTYLMLGLSAIATLASIATIAAQKFAQGGRVDHPGNGKIRVPSNIPIQANGDDVLATVKRGEVILNEEQQKRLGGPSVFRAAGVPGFASGGLIKAPWLSRPYRGIDYGKITHSIQVLKFAEGGRVLGPPPNEQNLVTKTDPELIDMLNKQHQINAAMIQTIANLKDRLDQPFETRFSLRSFYAMQAYEKRRADDSEMK